jgi:hypothetical protein
MVTAAVLLATAQQDIEYIPVLSCSINSTLSRKCLVKNLFMNNRKDFSVKKNYGKNINFVKQKLTRNITLKKVKYVLFRMKKL